MSKVFSLRLPDSLLEELDRLCEATGRRRNSLVQTAIESYLKNFGEYEIAQKQKYDQDYQKVVKTLKKTLGRN
jgi:predicted DNA-binding protein